MAHKLSGKRIAILSAAVLGLVVAGKFVAVVAVSVMSPSWRMVRSALLATYSSPASYTQVVERQFGSRRREEFRVWQAGTRRKVVQVSPRSLEGSTVFRDGLTEKAFLPGFRYALETGFAPDLRREVPPRLWRPGFHLPRVAVGSGILPGHGPLRLLTVRVGGEIQVRFWVDPHTNFIVRQERYAPGGRLFDVTENRDLVVSPAGLNEALKVELPPGTTKLADARRWRSELVAFTLAKEAPFPFLLPGRLPNGFRLVYGEVLHTAGVEVIALSFARHRAGFTLFEYPDRAAGTALPGDQPLPAPRRLHGRLRLFRTVRAGFSLVAIGRLTEPEFREITASLEQVSPALKQDNPDGSRTKH